MKIGLDYISVFSGGGNATYARELIRGLSRIDQKNNYYLYTYLHKFLPFYRNEIVHKDNFDYKVGYFCWPYKILKKNIHVFEEQLLFQRSKKDKIDLFHITNPLRFNRYLKNFIITIHDLCYLKESSFIKKSSIDFYQKNFKDILNNCQSIISVSQSTKKDILDNFDFPADKIFVIYEGISKIFKPKPNKDYIKEKFNLNKEYILSVGEIQPRKNLFRLLQSYSQLSSSLRENYELVIAGQSRGGDIMNKLIAEVKKLKIENQVKFLGYVEINDLPYLYSSARVFAYPSLYEGFGLPVLESLACGTPVITSTNSSLPEVLGLGGILVDPYKVEEIKFALENILTKNDLRDNLSKEGIKHSNSFSWEKAAQQTLKIYEKY